MEALFVQHFQLRLVAKASFLTTLAAWWQMGGKTSGMWRFFRCMCGIYYSLAPRQHWACFHWSHTCKQWAAIFAFSVTLAEGVQDIGAIG